MGCGEQGGDSRDSPLSHCLKRKSASVTHTPSERHGALFFSRERGDLSKYLSHGCALPVNLIKCWPYFCVCVCVCVRVCVCRNRAERMGD